MEHPPHDPFAGYLEVMSVIGILELKRALILGSDRGDGVEEGDVGEGLKRDGSDSLLARIESGIREATELQVIYEEQIDDALHCAADRADALHVLFESISERMMQMQAWMEAAIEALPEADREEWDLLVTDYERIREQLGKTPPPGAEGLDMS
jgi:hypothetical protein